MYKEQELIQLICKNMPKSNLQINEVFESDCEIIEFNGGRLLVNIDEFSEEDMLREHDPFTLGWNMAVGGLSDILATGGTPIFYGHSLVMKNTWSDTYIKRLAEGVAACLKEAGACFIGGDFGKSPVWRYTATILGDLAGEPILRTGAQPGDAIYITGEVGLGNVEAGLKLYANQNFIKYIVNSVCNKFTLRNKEASLIKKYSKCSIDTSDGVFNALSCISKMSNTGYIISNLPYVKSGVILAKVLSMPKTMLFLGECGEYELLFTVERAKEEAFIGEAKERGLIFYRIGEVTDPAKKELIEDNRVIDLHTFNIRARDYEDIKVYLQQITSFIKGD